MSCARSPPSCRPTASWSRPTRRISRPALPRQAQRAGLRGGDRPDARRGARRLARGDRPPDHREFLPPVRQGAARRGRGRVTPAHDACLHHPGLRLVRRGAARSARLGALQPARPEELAAPHLAAGRARGGEGVTRAWSTPRPTCGNRFSMPTSTGSTASCSPTTTPTTPMGSTTCAASGSAGVGWSTSIWTRQPRGPARPLRLLLRDAPGSEYPPTRMEHRLVPGRALEIAGEGGAILRCRTARSTARPPRSGSASARWPLPAT